MRALEAKVAQPLKLSNTGVDQYMQVDASNIGRVTVLPAPSYAGMYAQLCANPGDNVRLGNLGKHSRLNWGVLLDAKGNQYGHPMEYGAQELGAIAQVFYVGTGKHFKRSNLHASGMLSKKKRSVDVELVGKNVVPVRYSGWNQDATLDDLNGFQGFVVTMQPGKRPTYRIWFELTAENFKAACQDDRYEGIHGMIAMSEYSIISSGDKFTVGGLEEALARREEAAKPKAKARAKAKYATLKLHGDDRTVEVRVEAGTYDAERLFLTKIQARTSGRGKPKGKTKKDLAVVTKFYGHLMANDPLMFGDREIHKKQELTFNPDQTYEMRMGDVVQAAEPTQPVYKKPEPKAPEKPAAPPKQEAPAPAPQAPAPGSRAERRRKRHEAEGRKPAPTPTPEAAPQQRRPTPEAAPSRSRQRRSTPQPRRREPTPTPPPQKKKEMAGAGSSSWKEKSSSRPAREQSKRQYRRGSSGG